MASRDVLTPRERDVLAYVCAGDSNKGIAERLGVSEQAIKGHVSRLFLKFGVENRAGLVGVALRQGTVGAPTNFRDAAAAAVERLFDQQLALLDRARAQIERARSSARSDREREDARLRSPRKVNSARGTPRRRG